MRQHTTSIRNPLQKQRREPRVPVVLYFILFIALVSLLGFIGMVHLLHNSSTLHTPKGSSSSPISLPKTSKDIIQNDLSLGNQLESSSLWKEFYNRYGGKETALSMLQRGITTYNNNIDATAERILRAAAHQRPFVVAFAGYSVTVGRGNFFNQSFPFVMERVLSETFQSTFGIPLVVRNGAIGGIPSFPYAFCFEHFLGDDPDVVSWDYSMNEGNGAAVLETYIRQALQLPKRPMILLLDVNKARCNLLQTYVDMGILPDPISVGKGEVVDPQLMELEESQKPPGLQDWNVFGAPGRCPGRGSWHPKKKEHELIGWMIAMHFLKAMERARVWMEASDDWKSDYRTSPHEGSLVFPATVHTPPNNDPAITDLLFGHKIKDNTWQVKHVSCRTSFLPASDHDKVLPSIVVSGLSEQAELDMMEDRSDASYASGWVLDVSKVERDTKRKVERCGGLGYVDMKIALYGIPASGTLRLWLPFEGPSHDSHDHPSLETAKHWFDELVVCEANEKRESGACKLDRDIVYTVGGVPVESVREVSGAGEYLRRKTCVHVGVPATAQPTRFGDLTTAEGQPISLETQQRLGNPSDDAVGLVVDVQAKPNVNRQEGACCLSHIVWEQH